MLCQIGLDRFRLLIYCCHHRCGTLVVVVEVVVSGKAERGCEPLPGGAVWSETEKYTICMPMGRSRRNKGIHYIHRPGTDSEEL
ncbi:hypothetical protein KOW79_008854 [Hemibagrus wyckioides]|uniref:Uncharacterized protein n=1 Tax=Hemibagrus wyckioides TaxID=337641 RepID=A0A9D3NQL8_9TELE|nr:hypothetical protein KOW79_008854 [Hemibagrus wyckioides]